LLIAQEAMEIKDATVDIIIKLWLTLKIKVLQLKLHSHTLVKMEDVTLMEVLSKFQVLEVLRDVLVFKLQLLQDQLVFQLMLPTGANTAQVFSIIVEPVLITIFSLSDILILIGKSRTHGEQVGEKKVTLD
jgi:hypothetical protein